MLNLKSNNICHASVLLASVQNKLSIADICHASMLLAGIQNNLALSGYPLKACWHDKHQTLKMIEQTNSQ